MKHLLPGIALLCSSAAISQTTIPDTKAIPLADTSTSQNPEELDEIQVSTTRSSRSIRDIPTRIEFIAGEELDEKGNMKPGDIRMLLAESTGIQTQQTSATSANASIRIQGLDGRYTQILKDGFPVYSGAAGGLGLLQTPPLDLKQVEVVKGSASTLYGGGAIAGLVNLISKTPSATREFRILLNGTSALGLDASVFYGQRFGKIGTTVFASRNSTTPYDPAGIGFTAIPKVTRYTLNPRLFFYPSARTTLVAGLNAVTEERTGGSIAYLRNRPGAASDYFERNKSDRISTQLSALHQLKANTSLGFRNSYSYFNRSVETPGYRFAGTQRTTYSEATVSHGGITNDWVAGLNFTTDAFREELPLATPLRDYAQQTLGAFVQNTWHAGDKFFIESGLRGDYVAEYGFALLPRLSLLYKFHPRLSSRLGGGFGYKAPNIFTEESERIQYRDVLPISSHTLEKSYGANWDVNYRTTFAGGSVSLSFNQLLFYTRISRPLLLQQLANGQYAFINSTGHIESKGLETNARLGFRDFKLFLGYTYTDASVLAGTQRSAQLLTPKHRVNAVVMYEKEEHWKLGLEGYYYSPQRLSDGTGSRPYWLCGFMAERLWERFSVYINFENLLDVRQTRFESIYTGPDINPQFRDIYAPLDGFVVNGGVKLSL